MVAVFGALYLVLILAVIIASGFIVFHIVRYSYDKMAKKIMLTVFMLVAGTLFVINLFLFVSLPLKEML